MTEVDQQLPAALYGNTYRLFGRIVCSDCTSQVKFINDRIEFGRTHA